MLKPFPNHALHSSLLNDCLLPSLQDVIHSFLGFANHVLHPTLTNNSPVLVTFILRIPIMRCQVWPTICSPTGISYKLRSNYVLGSLHNAATLPTGTYSTGVKYIMSRQQYIEISSIRWSIDTSCPQFSS